MCAPVASRFRQRLRGREKQPAGHHPRAGVSAAAREARRPPRGADRELVVSSRVGTSSGNPWGMVAPMWRTGRPGLSGEQHYLTALRITSPSWCASSSTPGASRRCPPTAALRSSTSSAQLRRVAAGDHRRLDAGRAVERDRRPHRERVQPRRAELHRRRRVRELDGRDPGRREGAPGRRLRPRRHRRRRPLDGRRDLREVLRRSARSRPTTPRRSTTPPTASSWARACGILVLKRLRGRRARRRSRVRRHPRHRRLVATARARASPRRTSKASSSRCERAYAEAGIDPADVDLFECHGTSHRRRRQGRGRGAHRA